MSEQAEQDVWHIFYDRYDGPEGRNLACNCPDRRHDYAYQHGPHDTVKALNNAAARLARAEQALRALYREALGADYTVALSEALDDARAALEEAGGA